jgi:hypothetical protein
MKTPAHTNPTYVVARVKKLLAAKGWPIQRVSGRYAPFGGGTKEGTEGFHVSKIGCGKWVSVDYAAGFRCGYPSNLALGVVKAKREEAIAFLRELGYRIDERGWIECDGYDSCDR